MENRENKETTKRKINFCPKGLRFWTRLVLSVSAATLAAAYLPATALVLHYALGIHPISGLALAMAAVSNIVALAITIALLAALAQAIRKWAAHQGLPA